MKIKRTGRGARTKSGLFEAVRDERNAAGHAHVVVVVGHAERARQLGAVELGGGRWQVAAPNGDHVAFDLEVPQ